MNSGWSFNGESASLGEIRTRSTLVFGSTFCVSSSSGDISPGEAQGLFVEDIRHLSGLELLVDGHAPEILATVAQSPSSMLVVGRSARQLDGSTRLLVLRNRQLDPAMRESVVLRNPTPDPVTCEVALRVEADFATLFDVKEGRHREPAASASSSPARSEVEFATGDGEIRVVLRLSEPFTLGDDILHFSAVVPGRGEWRSDLAVNVESRRPSDFVARSQFPETSSDQEWPVRRVTYSGAESMRSLFENALVDLSSLRVRDERYGTRPVFVAGAPWFMTLFGRDSLLTSWMALLVQPESAIDTLWALAGLQGVRVDNRTDEEPGRIMHEVRFGRSSLLEPGAGAVYYGSADATPLFVMLVAEAARWGIDPSVIRSLLPHVDRALDWIQQFGDRDGDGFVEYARRAPKGLRNQGWKDSWDAISFADGTLAEPPVALCEVQAYVYRAWLDRAELAVRFDDGERAAQCQREATALRERFEERFWIDELGWYAMALDRDKRPVDALASNMGHALWAGIVDRDRAQRVAELLLSRELFSGWGLRTLASSMARYDPLSYHNGSVWPHDTAIAVAGLSRYGFHEEAATMAEALVEASEHFGHRLPELFTGLHRDEVGQPVDYPMSSFPQAWSAAAPLLLLRSAIGLNPDIPKGVIGLRPCIDERETFRIDGLPFGPDTSLIVDSGAAHLSGLASNVRVHSTE